MALLGDSAITFVARLFAAAMVFASGALLARSTRYGEGDFAQYASSLEYLNYGSVVLGLGLPTSMVYHGVRDSNAQVTFAQILELYGAIGILCVAAGLLIGGPMAFLVVLPGLLANNLAPPLHVVYRDYLRYGLALICIPTGVFAAIAASIISQKTLEPLWLIGAGYLVGVAGNLLLAGSAERLPRWRNRPERTSIRKLISYGWQFTLTNALGLSLYIVDIFLLDIFGDEGELAIYLVAVMFSRLLPLVIDSISVALFRDEIDNTNQSNDKVRRLVIFSTALHLAALLGCLALGRLIIRWTFGDDLVDAWSSLVVLVVASLGISGYKFGSRVLAARGQWMPIYKAIVPGVALNVAINLVLIPRYGALGAAVASAIAYWLTGALAIVAVERISLSRELGT